MVARARLAEEYGIGWAESEAMSFGDLRFLLDRSNDREEQAQQQQQRQAIPEQPDANGIKRVRL